MKRLSALLLTLILLVMALPGLASQATKDSFVGTWHQTNEKGESWTIELKADGTGSMRNSHQEIPITWDMLQIMPDANPSIGIYADFGDGKMTLLDDFYFKDGVLEGLNGLKFDRGEPDIVFIEPYEAAKFAPVSAFDGVWEMTGGLLTVVNPPISMELGMAELGMKPPVYIGIKDGRVLTSNQGDTTTGDSGVISYYAGNAIYAGRAPLGITAVLYYVAPGMIHVKYAGPPMDDEFGIDVVFTMTKTKLEKIPVSDEEWDNFPSNPELFKLPAP